MCDKILPFYKRRRKGANSFSYKVTTFGNSNNALSSQNKMWEKKKMCDKILPFYKRRRKNKKANTLLFSTRFGNSENGFALLKYGLGIVCPQKWRGERGGTTVMANELLQKVIGLWLCLCNQLPPNPSCTIPFSPSRIHLLWTERILYFLRQQQQEMYFWCISLDNPTWCRDIHYECICISIWHQCTFEI